MTAVPTRRLGILIRAFVAVGVLGALMSGAGPATAGLFTIQDANSVVKLDTSAGTIYDWFVDGTDQLNDEWFYISIDGGAVQAISVTNGWTVDVEGTTDSNFDGDDDTFFGRYFDPTGVIGIEIRLSLLGGTSGDGVSDLAEQVLVFSTGGTHDIRFFEYSNFDLGATPDNDYGLILSDPPNDFFQIDDPTGGWSLDIVSTFSNLTGYSVSNDPSALSSNILAGALDNNPGPFSGDLAQAFQWSATVGPTNSLLISKDKLITRPLQTPEPSSIALMSLGGVGLLGAALRRRRAA